MLLVVFQDIGQVREGVIGGRGAFAFGCVTTGGICIDQAGMFVFMAIHTQQFPVAAIGWIIVVVMVPMVDGEFPQVFAIELAATPATDPGIHFECLFPVCG